MGVQGTLRRGGYCKVVGLVGTGLARGLPFFDKYLRLLRNHIQKLPRRNPWVPVYKIYLSWTDDYQ